MIYNDTSVQYLSDEYTIGIINQAFESHGLIVCQSNIIAEQIQVTAKYMGISIMEPISIQWLSLYKQQLDNDNIPVVPYEPMKIIQHLLESNEEDRKKPKTNTRFHNTNKKHK